MCLAPITIKNPRYGVALTPWGRFIDVPCNKCVQCLEHNISATLGRLLAHAVKFHGFCVFVTLTIDNDVIPIDPTYPGVDKSHLRPLIDGINNSNKRHGTDYSYYFVSEYGSDADRPHYHGILYGFDNLKDCEDFVHKYYKLGFVTVSEVVPERFNYIANAHVSKYSHVPWRLESYEDFGIFVECNKPFVLSSRGLGYDFVDKYRYQIKRDRVLNLYGRTYPLHASLANHLAKLYHCSVPMLWYQDNMRQLRTFEKPDNFIQLLDYLCIDYHSYNLDDPKQQYRLLNYVQQQLKANEHRFSRKYSTKTSTLNF